MSKIIIHIDDSISDEDACRLVSHVVCGGKVSKTAGVEHYCAVTTWKTGHIVYSTASKSGTFTFRIWKE